MTQSTTAPAAEHRWRAFGVLAAAYFMTIVDLTVTNVALPSIGRALSFAEGDLQWIVTAYGITFGGILLLGGRLSDALGRRRVFVVGMAVLTLASLACGLAGDDLFLIVARGVQGLGAALLLPAALGTVLAIFPEGADRNGALGVWSAMGAMGATAGLLAGGLLTKYVGWEAIFFANLPVGVAAIALAPVWVPATRASAISRRVDPLGALLITGGLVVLVYTISTAPTEGWATLRTASLLAVAVVLIAGFALAENRSRQPLLRGRLVPGRALVNANVVGFLLGASFYSFLFIGTLYMQDILGWSALETGLAWLITSLSSVALAAGSQQLVTRLGPAPVMVVGMTLMAAGIAWGTGIVVDGRLLADLTGPLLLVGAGTAFSFIPISVAGLAGVPAAASGVASGLLNTSQQLGGAIGVAVVSTVATSHTIGLLGDGVPMPQATTEGFRWAIWVCAAIALAAAPVGAIAVDRRRTVLTEARVAS